VFIDMQQASTHPIVQRAQDVAQLKGRTYAEIARDPNATKEAALVVVLVAIATGIGSAGDGSNGIIGGIIAGLLGWVIFSAVTYFVSNNITGGPTTASSVESLMRTLGYARVPGLLAIFGFIWLLGDIVTAVAGLWVLATSVYAIRRTLNMNWIRAIATGLIAAIISGLVTLILRVLLDISIPIAF
jgi:hypothetical protein